MILLPIPLTVLLPLEDYVTIWPVRFLQKTACCHPLINLWGSGCPATFLASHEWALGVSLAQPPPESWVPSNHTSSVQPVSQPIDPAISAQVQAATSAPENCQPPACAGSEKALSRKVDKPAISRKVDQQAVSRKVDYGPMRDHWLQYSFVKGLEKKNNSQSTTSSQESICHASHEGTGANV